MPCGSTRLCPNQSLPSLRFLLGVFSSYVKATESPVRKKITLRTQVLDSAAAGVVNILSPFLRRVLENISSRRKV